MSSEPSIDQSVAELCASKPPDYDMKDSEDSGCWPHLEPTLQYCETAVSPAYYAADSAARRHQRRHKWLVLIAAIGGMFAVLLAIMQLYLVGSETPLIGASLVQAAEIVAAAVAGLAVALGLLAVFSSKWLLERERAERCRLVKFRFLLTPELWSRAQPEDRLALQKLLRSQIERVEALDEKSLDDWARGKGEVLEATPPQAAPAGLDEEVLTQLIGYYEKKRLKYQQQYYEHQIGRHNYWERHTRRVPYLLFFLSVLAALGHFVYDLVTGTHGEPVSSTLVVLAASLPVVGIAVRTWRAAHEFGRNTLRFEATSNELKRLAGDLQKENSPQMKLEVLRHIEKVLEAERREWLRLMRETEWFG